MKPLDNKQIPQVVALAVLALAFFGYFAAKMIMPTPAAAGTQVAAVVAAKPLPKTAAAAATPDAPVLTAPAPGPGMHDPFVQAVSDSITPVMPTPAARPAPALRTASLKAAGVAPLTIPYAPALPSAGGRGAGFPAFGVPPSSGIPSVSVALPAPAAPTWTVTGVLQSGAEHVAILRSGEARRFVKQGDFVDGEFVVASVTRDTVVLRHGHSRFVLPLGGPRAVPAASGKAAAPGTAGFSPGAVPDASAFGIGRPAQSGPRPRTVKRAGPDIASLPTSRGVWRRLAMAAPRSRPGPTVRVADYQGEAVSVAPAAGRSGLLPSGMEAPDFSLSTLDGDALSLSQFRGNVVVLDFWASWCAPSARTLAPLGRLQKGLGAQGLTVLAVNSWDSKAGMQAALQGGGGSLTHLYDPGVSSDSVAVRLYHAPDVPMFYVIDREGRVAGAFVGCGQGTIRNIQATLARLGIVPQGTTL